MNKKEARIKYRALRSKLDEDAIDNLSMDIANKLLTLPIWEQKAH